MVRVSGPAAFVAGAMLAGSLPEPRRAALRRLSDRQGAALDDALVIAFPGPRSATGEDLLEMHLHGGRAVVRAVLGALATMPNLRAAEAGEFTRRALGNGRIDLAEAEGLADLLAAESEIARRAALTAAEGGVSRMAHDWAARLLALSARLEAQIDFADEDDLPAEASEIAAIASSVDVLAAELSDALAKPPVERLRDGFRIVLAGPPNSGKSSLINAMAEREVAIASAVPGTTRDRIDAPVLRAGIGYLLTDTAGLRDDASDSVEKIGIERTGDAIRGADLVIWLGDDTPPDTRMLPIHARADEVGRRPSGERLQISAVTGAGIAELWEMIARHCEQLVAVGHSVWFNDRQRTLLVESYEALRSGHNDDLVLLAESLRLARSAVDRVTGTTGVEAMLDDLFGRFCIGK